MRIMRGLGLCMALAAGLVGALPARGEAPEAARHFEEGNRHYEAGRFGEALAAYRQAAGTGLVSDALYYNMGNAYFRLGELGEAIRHYEKARRLMPGDDRVRHNLNVAFAHTVDRFPEMPVPFWDRWWAGILATLGAGGLLFIGLALYLAALGLVAHRVWTRRPSPWRRRALLLLLPLAGLFLAAAFAASGEALRHRQAVVLATAVPLREEAGGVPLSTVVHEGLLVRVLDEADGWRQVRLPNGTTGWLETRVTGDV